MANHNRLKLITLLLIIMDTITSKVKTQIFIKVYNENRLLNTCKLIQWDKLCAIVDCLFESK
jgi:hypothetical protein